MSRLRAFGLGVVLAFSPCAASVAEVVTDPFPDKIPHGPVRIELQPLAAGLVAPTAALPAGDGSGRLFIVDQTGKVLLHKSGAVQPTPFLDLSSRLVSLSPGYDERGFLGMAFDPGFSDPASPGFRRIFTYTSEPDTSGTPDFLQPIGTGNQTVNHHSVVASWRVDPANPDLVDPASRQELMRFQQPQSNHNGGYLAFGPDNLLYIATGDGGGANDNNPNGHEQTVGNGQTTSTVLGKILRIDPNGTNSANGKYGIPAGNPFAGGAGGLPEIYAHGFRNPFRFSFDGDELLVADVGQNRVEELNRVTVGGNYGWHFKEGSFKFNTDGTIDDDLTGLPAGLIDPILEYDHDEGISIIGGFVYRGSALPELDGKYVFGDFSTSFGQPRGRLFYADLDTGEINEFIIGDDDRMLGIFVKGMGIDESGEIYVIGSSVLGPAGTGGVVLKLVPVPEPASALLALGAAGLLALRRPRGRRCRRRCAADARGL